MTERHAILTAIRENPDDDTPRLVYADWLEEHGEPERAELVRVQVEIAKTWQPRLNGSGAWWGSASASWEWQPYDDLRRREQFLIATCTDFLPECRQCDCTGLVPSFDRVDFTRGILEELECTWEIWREHGDLIWERELPWKVRLTTSVPDDSGGTVYFDQVWMLTALGARWPGIEFELPPVGSRGPDSPQLRWRNFAMRYEDLPRG